MKVAIMQPYFFPYIGYFSLLKHVDSFILLDDVQFIRHGWIERNRILKPSGGWQYISVPLMKHSQKTAIRDIRINNGQEWKKKIFAQLEHYRKAPYYRNVKFIVEEVFSKQYISITELDYQCLKAVCDYLDIKTNITIFRDLNINLNDNLAADEWALEICKQLQNVDEYWNPPGGQSFFDRDKYKKNLLKLKFLETVFQSYKQRDEQFIEGLSIIDVMMFNNVTEINQMLDRYILFE